MFKAAVKSFTYLCAVNHFDGLCDVRRGAKEEEFTTKQ